VTNVLNDLSAMNSQGQNASSSTSSSQGTSSSNSTMAEELSQMISLFAQEQSSSAGSNALNTLV